MESQIFHFCHRELTARCIESNCAAKASFVGVPYSIELRFKVQIFIQVDTATQIYIMVQDNSVYNSSTTDYVDTTDQNTARASSSKPSTNRTQIAGIAKASQEV